LDKHKQQAQGVLIPLQTPSRPEEGKAEGIKGISEGKEENRMEWKY